MTRRSRTSTRYLGRFTRTQLDQAANQDVIRWRRPSDAAELRDLLADAYQAQPGNGYLYDTLHEYTELARAMEADPDAG